MNCEYIADLLPQLLNGTLEAKEQEQILAHLRECTTCQEELGEARALRAFFQQHVPTRVLIAHAYRQPLTPLEQNLVERHLETCVSCAQELALVQESQQV